jgi:DNA modification methylase
MEIEQWPIERLRPYARNPRKNDAVVPKMVEVLREFGFRIPILAKSDGEVIDGHLRLKAALQMGWKTVPVTPADDMSDAQIRAFRIMVNKSAVWAEWDDDLLVEELRALQMENFDIRFTGFDMAELAKLLPPEEAPISENAPEEENLPSPPADPVTRPGDIWQIGEHILACADASDADAVAELMSGEQAALCFTSPPYGEQREYTRKVYDWDALMRGVFRDALLGRLMRHDGQVLVNLGLVHRDHEVRPYWHSWIQEMRDRGWRFFGWYVWDQGSGLPGDWSGRLAPSHEFIFHFNKQERRPNKIVACVSAGEIPCHRRKDGTPTGIRLSDGKFRKWTHEGSPVQDFRIPDSILRINRQAGGIGKDIDHPAVFPLELPEHVIATWTQPGDVVFEPFCGSGSTIIAGQRKGVRVRAVEIAPEYVDVALIRFSRFYPDTPITLASTGEDFAMVAARRKEESHA